MTTTESRKQKSEKLLKSLGADFLPSLPILESDKETKLRESSEVGARILCLVSVSAAADGIDKARLLEWLKAEGLDQYLSTIEMHFLKSEGVTEKEKIRYSWLCESIWLLLWATNKVDRNLPTEHTKIQNILEVIPQLGASTADFVNGIKLKDKSELLDMSDLLYRAHWTIRQSDRDKKTNKGKLESGVVAQWHHAINWLTCYGDVESWDEVSTDT